MASVENADWRAEYRFASHWMPMDGGRVHYIDEGPRDAPVVLFVHGNPTWSFHWRRLVGGLAGERRCVAIDHLGCGLSDKPQRRHRMADHVARLGRLVDELRLDRVTLVAQDWGGAIGLAAMADRLDQLDRVLLFNTGAWPPKRVPWRIAACRLPGVGRLALQGANLFSLAALRMTLARRKRLAPTVAAGYLAPYTDWASRRAVYEFVRDIPTQTRHPTHGTLAELERRLPVFRQTPVRLVWGMQDWCFTAEECLRRFQRAWAHADSVELPDVGHWVVEDAPEDALAQLADFVGASALPAGPSVEPRATAV